MTRTKISFDRWVRPLVLFAVAASTNVPAHSQLAATVAVQNDLRFRARSLSEGDPVATVTLNYDDASGAYIGTNATVRLTGDAGPGLLGQQAFAGFATHVSEQASIDVGVTGYRYTRLYSGRSRDEYVEVYAGVTGRNASVYMSFTPDYFDRGVPVIHLNAALSVPVASRLQLYGSIGALVQTSGPPRLGGESQRYDAAIAISREVGRLTLLAEATFGGPGGNYYSGPWRGRNALTLTARRSF